jgi:hypothetical protein
MTTPSERAERERLRKSWKRRGHELGTVRGHGFVLYEARDHFVHAKPMMFQDPAEVAEELRVRGKP